MKYILTIAIAIMVGCGSIGDGDTNTEAITTSENKQESSLVRPGENDGDLIVRVDAHKEIVINVNDQISSAGTDCDAGKICRGMTRQEVFDVIGEPTSVGDERHPDSLYGNFLVWDFQDREPSSYPNEDSQRFCTGTDYFHLKCKLWFAEYNFDGENLTFLIDAEDMAAHWTDPVNF
jgi:hypothetical protein